MSGSAPATVRRLVGGGLFVLAADGLQLPTALILAAYLSRRLGPEGLALYLLGASVVTAIQLGVNALFSRATVQLVAEREDWRPVAALVLRWHLGLTVALTALLVAVVAPFEAPFGVPGLREVLLVFALELPIFGLARTHTQLLVGLGRFRERAASGAARWIGRLLFVVLFVEAGLGARGAALGAVASTAIELLVARLWARPSWRIPAPEGLGRRLARFSAPLFLHALALQLFQRLGLLLLVPLGATVAAAGLYGAAESLLRVRRVLGQSLTPLLLSAITALERDGHAQEAKRLARNGLRAVALSVPPFAAIAGAAPAVMAALFGEAFRDGGAPLAVLMGGGPGALLLAVATAILVAGGRPDAPLRLTAPLVPLAVAGYWLAIPAAGGLGAAWITTALFNGVAVAALLVVRSATGVTLPVATLARAALGGAVAWAAASVTAVQGPTLLIALPAACLAGWGAVAVLGETDRDEMRRFWALLRAGRPTRP